MLTELKHELGKKLAKNYGQMCSQTPDDERYSAIDSGLYSQPQNGIEHSEWGNIPGWFAVWWRMDFFQINLIN